MGEVKDFPGARGVPPSPCQITVGPAGIETVRVRPAGYKKHETVGEGEEVLVIVSAGVSDLLAAERLEAVAAYIRRHGLPDNPTMPAGRDLSEDDVIA
jgi:hypothetical protein